MRPATRDDVPAVAVLAAAARAEFAAQARGGPLFLAREARPDPVTEVLHSLVDGDGSLVLAGYIDTVMVGYGVARLEHLRDGTILGVIDELFVEPGARGVGVGESLMAELLAWFRDRGCMGVDGYALPGMRETKNFFETAGFTARLLVVHHRFDDAAP